MKKYLFLLSNFFCLFLSDSLSLCIRKVILVSFCFMTHYFELHTYFLLNCKNVFSFLFLQIVKNGVVELDLTSGSRIWERRKLLPTDHTEQTIKQELVFKTFFSLHLSIFSLPWWKSLSLSLFQSVRKRFSWDQKCSQIIIKMKE